MADIPTGKDELAYWLALIRAPGVGPRVLRRVLESGASPRAVFELARRSRPGRLGLDGRTWEYLRHPDWDAVERDLAWLARSGCSALTWHQPDYPALLRQISDPPPLLFVQGDSALLSRGQLAIVGSRNPSAHGRELAWELARSLAAAGLVITSGLAAGVDAAGHRGALAADGLTVAVLGTGPDRIYPSAHRDLAGEIARCGALISEFPPGTAPRPHHFPRRNRLISGLSLGTLVVEAAARSGSLITARFAVEQGREVFAVPGSIHNPLARGCHALIREGAKLVETVNDIVEELGALAGALAAPVAPAAGRGASGAAGGPWSAQQARLMGLLGFDPTPMDVLIERSGLTAEEVSSMLLVLELQGYVVATPGGQFCRSQP